MVEIPHPSGFLFLFIYFILFLSFFDETVGLQFTTIRLHQNLANHQQQNTSTFVDKKNLRERQ